MAEFLQFKGPLVEEAAGQIKALYELLGQVDATLLEVNPFGETEDGRVVCFDAKLNFDDNASFRSLFNFDLHIHNGSTREVERKRGWKEKGVGRKRGLGGKGG